MATIYMPPLCKKKRVLDKYDPDTFRVISQDAEDTHSKTNFVQSNEPSEWRKKWLDNSGLALPDIYNKRTEVLSHSAPDYRAHKPHPGSCGFLRYNVRFLNEPVCSVYTEVTRDEQHDWWPSRISKEPLKEPPKTKDTIYRADFAAEKEGPVADPGSTRHTANPNVDPALGIVPVNFLRAKDKKQRFFKEKISYEHQYNSRKDPNYPIRAKRHGSFVWDQMSKDKTRNFINHYQVITPEEGIMRQERQEAEKLASQAEKLLIETSKPEPTTVSQQPAEPVAAKQPTSPIPDKSSSNNCPEEPKKETKPEPQEENNTTQNENGECLNNNAGKES